MNFNIYEIIQCSNRYHNDSDRFVILRYTTNPLSIDVQGFLSPLNINEVKLE